MWNSPCFKRPLLLWATIAISQSHRTKGKSQGMDTIPNYSTDSDMLLVGSIAHGKYELRIRVRSCRLDLSVTSWLEVFWKGYVVRNNLLVTELQNPSLLSCSSASLVLQCSRATRSRRLAFTNRVHAISTLALNESTLRSPRHAVGPRQRPSLDSWAWPNLEPRLSPKSVQDPSPCVAARQTSRIRRAAAMLFR